MKFIPQAAFDYKYSQPKNNQPSSVKEYQFAKQQGYKGSYEDFLNSKKATTNINTWHKWISKISS